MDSFVHEQFLCMLNYFSKVDSQKLTFTGLLNYHQAVCQEDHANLSSHCFTYQFNELKF